MGDRENQGVLWGDKEFINALVKVKADRFIKGKPVKSLGQLTKEMVHCPSFNKLVSELTEPKENYLIHFNIRLDKKRL